MLTTTPLRDVVGDDRLVADRRDRLEVLDDAARRRLVVVRRDDEEAVDAELVRPLGQVDGVRGGVRAGARDHGRPLADLVDRRRPQLELLLVGQRRRLAGRRGHDEAVRAVVDSGARARGTGRSRRRRPCRTASRSPSGSRRASEAIIGGGALDAVVGARALPARAVPRPKTTGRIARDGGGEDARGQRRSRSGRRRGSRSRLGRRRGEASRSAGSRELGASGEELVPGRAAAARGVTRRALAVGVDASMSSGRRGCGGTAGGARASP